MWNSNQYHLLLGMYKVCTLYFFDAITSLDLGMRVRHALKTKALLRVQILVDFYYGGVVKESPADFLLSNFKLWTKDT